MNKAIYTDRFAMTLSQYPSQTWFHNDIKQKYDRMRFHKKITAMLPKSRALFRESLGLGPRQVNESLEVDSKYIRFSHIKVITLWTGFPPDKITSRPEYKLIVRLKNNQWLMLASVDNVVAWINFTQTLGCVASYIPRVIRCPIWQYEDVKIDENGIALEHNHKDIKKAKYQDIKQFVELGYDTVDIIHVFPEMLDATVRYNIKKAKKEIEKNGKADTNYHIRVI